MPNRGDAEKEDEMTADSIDICAFFSKASVMNEAQKTSTTGGGRHRYEQGTFYCVGNVTSSANATFLARVLPECGCLFLGSCNPQACLIFDFLGAVGCVLRPPFGVFYATDYNLYSQTDGDVGTDVSIMKLCNVGFAVAAGRKVDEPK